MKILLILFLFSTLSADNSNSLLMATAALNAGMYEEALTHIKRAKLSDPTSPEVYQMKAFLHEALHQPKEALQAWSNCLKYSRSKKLKEQARNHINILSDKSLRNPPINIYYITCTFI